MSNRPDPQRLAAHYEALIKAAQARAAQANPGPALDPADIVDIDFGEQPTAPPWTKALWGPSDEQRAAIGDDPHRQQLYIDSLLRRTAALHLTGRRDLVFEPHWLPDHFLSRDKSEVEVILDRLRSPQGPWQAMHASLHLHTFGDDGVHAHSGTVFHPVHPSRRGIIGAGVQAQQDYIAHVMNHGLAAYLGIDPAAIPPPLWLPDVPDDSDTHQAQTIAHWLRVSALGGIGVDLQEKYFPLPPEEPTPGR